MPKRETKAATANTFMARCFIRFLLSRGAGKHEKGAEVLLIL
jgi:hypothetical protein